jgi:hypothetical protein
VPQQWLAASLEGPGCIERLLFLLLLLLVSPLDLRLIGLAWFEAENPTMVTWLSPVEQYVEAFTAFIRAL